jgi:hypothetical protein
MSVPLAFERRSAVVVSCLRSGKHALWRARAWLRTMAGPGQEQPFDATSQIVDNQRSEALCYPHLKV